MFFKRISFAALLALALLSPSSSNAQSWPLGPFQRLVSTPIIQPNPASTFVDPITHEAVHWEAKHTFNPAAVVKDGKVVLLYRAEDDSGRDAIGGHTSRLGMAVSDDGIHFSMLPTPVFYPARDAQQDREWPGGVEDPRLVVTANGKFVLTYTQWNRKTYTVGLATSDDLIHWQKHGPIFADAAGGKYRNLAYKSAGIVTEVRDGRILAAKLHGRYWMYWGEVQVRLATSKDLVHWTPVEASAGSPKVLLEKRPGMFDSAFPEVGPPPLLLKKGIVLIYNGKNATTDGDPKFGPGAYSAGQALFSADDPSHLLSRADQPLLTPELPFEKTGQYVAGTVFSEGLVLFKGNWWLYYGAADSFVGVATSPAGQ